MSEDVSQQIIQEWMAARAVIAAWLRELIPNVDAGAARQAAENLIARLAAHEPPFLLMTAHLAEAAPGGPADVGEGKA